ncbi:hypothetical protein [Rhizobium leguminosarum]|uniref:hypothetical protein n=1 Tax=Rhizobium leguminosarum TaxID=384 RepID=UPI003F988260
MAKPKTTDDAELIKEWPLSTAATLGSSVRAKGILLEIRARLPLAVRKSLEIEAGALTLAMAETAKSAFRAASSVVSNALEDIESLPVIPREIQDILTISTTERHRWLSDGRLPSAGTRTVKLRGRARKITFHVFDPRVVEDILDRDLVTVWREEDAEATAEKRRRAALKAKLTRSLKTKAKTPSKPDADPDDASRSKALGWEEFSRDGLLR